MMFKAKGIEDEMVKRVVGEHVECIDGLKAERDRYEEGAEGARGLRRQLEGAGAAGESFPKLSLHRRPSSRIVLLRTGA